MFRAERFAGLVFQVVNSRSRGGSSGTPEGTYSYSVLNSFTGGANGGRISFAGLVHDAAGNLYGTTFYGGSSFGAGVVNLTLQ
jgi:hypothetical protein